jgi:hypothetical protein
LEIGFSFFTAKFAEVSQESTKFYLPIALKAGPVAAMGATHGTEVQ